MAPRIPKKDTAIKKEIKRLDGILSNVDENKKSIVEGLIKRASFMRATLEEMEADLNENGFTEMFSQSDNQEPYERVRPVATQYQTLNKNYQAIMKQLTDLLPKNQVGIVEDDGFNNFVTDRD